MRRTVAALAAMVAVSGFISAGATAAQAAAAVSTQPALSFPQPVQVDQPQGDITGLSCVGVTCSAIDVYGDVITEAAGSWSAPVPVDPTYADGSNGSHGYLYAISCPVPGFCATVDKGRVLLEHNGTWSQPVVVDTEPLLSISCTSTTFCLAIDQSGRDVRYDGTSWSSPLRVGDGFYDLKVSCTSPTFCLAVAGPPASSGSWVFNGTSWSKVSQPDYMGSVSCVSPTRCFATGGQGDVLMFNGTAWSTPSSVFSLGFADVSCVATFCLAVGPEGAYETNSGTGWTASAVTDNGTDLTFVSCVAISSCVAVDHDGRALSYDGEWSVSTMIDRDQGAFRGVSCPTDTFCAAIDTGAVVFNHNGVWGEPMDVDPGGQLTSISCASADFCAASDYNSSYNFTYQNGVWSNLPRGYLAATLSCPSPTFCMGANDYGQVTIFDGTSWHGQTATAGGLVSCTSSKFCMMIGAGYDEDDNPDSTYSVRYDGSKFITVPIAHQFLGGGGLSCTSPTFCVLFAGSHVYRYDGKRWSAPVQVLSKHGVTSLSCVAEDECVAMTSDSAIVRLTASGWSVPLPLPHQPLGQTLYPSTPSVSCSSMTHCVAVELGDATIGGASHELTVGPNRKLHRGHHLTLSTMLAVNHQPIRAEKLTLYARPAGKHTFHSVGTATTDSAGSAHLRVTPTRTMTYEWAFAGTGDVPGSLSGLQKVKVVT